MIAFEIATPSTIAVNEDVVSEEQEPVEAPKATPTPARTTRSAVKSIPTKVAPSAGSASAVRTLPGQPPLEAGAPQSDEQPSGMGTTTIVILIAVGISCPGGRSHLAQMIRTNRRNT